MTIVTENRPTSETKRPAVQPKPHPWWHLSRKHVLVSALWAVGFYLLNRLPLQGMDFWGHVASGEWILAHGTIPNSDPFAPLLSGTQWIDGCWLSQLLYGAAAMWGGGEALSLLFAGAALTAGLILARTFYLQSRSVFITHVSVLLVVAVGWSYLSFGHSDVFGMLCLALLAWLLVRDRVADLDRASHKLAHGATRWQLWIGVPVLMMVWANLHSSFVYGLLILACWVCGLMVESGWRQRSLRACLIARPVRRRIWLLQLGLVATFLNPYGVRLILSNLWFTEYGQLQELPQWQHLAILDPGGRAIVLSLFVAMVLFKWSGRRVAVGDILLLVAFSFVGSLGLRTLWCYAAVFGVVVTPHLASLWERYRHFIPGIRHMAGETSLFGLPAGRSRTYSLVTPVLLWIALALAPAGESLISGKPRSAENLYGDGTPWKLTEFLREQPPQGQIFNPCWWGDWLAWDGPSGLGIFMTSSMHLAPRDVWMDYRIVRETRTGWNNVLNRYGVATVVLDKRRQKTLLRYLRASENWEVLYDDELGAVLGRVQKK